MSGKIVFSIYGRHEGREQDSYFGAYYTEAEALAEIEKLHHREMHGENWANRYHNLGFEIRTTPVATDFEIPSRPTPRERFCIRATPKQHRPGTWGTTVVEVFERGSMLRPLNRVCEYERNYAMLQTFEPFRQAGRNYALISRDYTQTAVLDLSTGTVIAEEGGEGSSGEGFCPVGFYVPDWWDVHSGATIPGCESWNEDQEWPTGNFGFVWGCHWGDDTSWKVQYLDLSRIREGLIRREERFGYVELATTAYTNPCLTVEKPDPARRSAPPFISVSRFRGVAQTSIAVEMEFDLESGEARDWKRQRIANFE